MIQAIQDHVIVRPIADEYEGLIVRPESAKRPASQHGEVVAVGPGRRSKKRGLLIPVGVQVGDRVLVARYKGTDIAIDGQRLRILRESEVLGVVE